jgi:CHRD domain
MKIVSGAIPAGILAVVMLGAASPSGCGGKSSTIASSMGNGSTKAGGMDDVDKGEFKARLTGFQETPAISTTGHGTFTASLSDDGTTVTFELTYADLKGVDSSGAPTLAHVHLGQRNVAGGVAVFLCGGGGRPACPAQPATVTGTFVAADVVGPTAQGIAAGDLSDLLQAARARVTYANVHTASFPTGEIRGQIRGGDEDRDEGKDDDD